MLAVVQAAHRGRLRARLRARPLAGRRRRSRRSRRSVARDLRAAGTLFSAIAVRTRYREVMLPLLLLPLLVPVLLGAVRATAQLLATGSLPWPPVQLLIVADAVF